MPPRHIAAMLVPSWGHTISYIYLASRMLQKDPTLVVTMVQHNLFVARMEAELKTCEYDSARLRIIGVGGEDIRFSQARNQLYDGWKEVIHKLAEGSEDCPTPKSLHMDFFGGGHVIEHTKQIMGPDCKILIWFSSGLASMPAILNEYDFAAIGQEIYSDEERRQARSLDEILDQIVLAWNGSDHLSGVVIKCPGVPDMYDHERVGHGAGPWSPDVSQVFVDAQKFAKVADGYIVPTSVCLEPVAVPSCREFYQQRGQELFTVGPQVHELCWTNAAPAPPTNEVVKSFLENSMHQYGSKSTLYISFGSICFPIATPELIAALLDTPLALDKPFPFIFALGGRMASLPKDVIDRVNSSGRGLVCDFWVEQRAILQHNAVGWFLTHGGYNSISESLSQGIPLIVWPVTGEAPINAALLSSGPNPVAIELMQVRTGPQRGPSLRGGPPITGTVADASAEFRAAFEAARGACRKNPI
ncbi:hypothetical protein FB451DRAFT_1490106 [Mycena latifolia]|nr:hypothetical protein FB451DRAFT_1490106 [Mycena latifolia]